MFTEVIQGHTNDPAAARRNLERWARTTGATNITAGVTADGRFIAVTTFGSEASARATNADWHDLLDGHVTVTNGTRTDIFTTGDLARARFVQIVQGQVTDLNAARWHKDALQEELAAHLPCLLGTLTVEHDEERFTRVLYFTTETEARAGERDMPAAVRRRDEPALRLLVGPLEFLDLRDPWLLSPQTTPDSA
jgi:hypothetical protein